MCDCVCMENKKEKKSMNFPPLTQVFVTLYKTSKRCQETTKQSTNCLCYLLSKSFFIWERERNIHQWLLQFSSSSSSSPCSHSHLQSLSFYSMVTFPFHSTLICWFSMCIYSILMHFSWLILFWSVQDWAIHVLIQQLTYTQSNFEFYPILLGFVCMCFIHITSFF